MRRSAVGFHEQPHFQVIDERLLVDADPFQLSYETNDCVPGGNRTPDLFVRNEALSSN